MKVTRICIYCERSKDDSEFSLEHIFPQELGGNLSSDLFKTRSVCARCNSLMGLFVDGMFLKNWFRVAYNAESAREYIDITSPSSVEPLIYMGQIKSLSLSNDEVCELWLGACGSVYYHFHAADEKRFQPYAGGDPIKRKADPGRVYLFLTSKQPLWSQLALRSFVTAFPKARRFAGNFGIADDPGRIVEAPDNIADEHLRRLAPLLNQEHSCEISYKLGFEGRWLAKLAVGLGVNLFGPSFLQTTYAKSLHLALWEQDPNKRAQIPVRGTGFLSDTVDQTDSVMGWAGGYTIRLHAVDDIFVLTIHLPNQKSLHVVISDEPSLWESQEFNKFRLGQIYISFPLLGRFVGPIGLDEYIGHRVKAKPVPELEAIERMRIDPSTLPPCR